MLWGVLLPCLVYGTSHEYYQPASDCPAKYVTDEVFITLLYGTTFILPVRVLGKSLDDSDTNRQKMVLATRDVSKNSIEQLQKDCWRVLQLDAIPNPFKNAPARFGKVLTKLHMWTLQEYRKVVYLDADTLVARNIDELFACNLFCASVRHSDKFNTGVMVLTPSKDTYESMMKVLPVVESYTGADQGFLNVYYKDLHKAPELGYGGSRVTDKFPLQRLSAAYNADEGMYYAQGGRWLFSSEEVKIYHYTFGPIRPWSWWVYPIFDNSHKWMTVRRTVAEAYAPLQILHFAMPYVLLLALLLRLLTQKKAIFTLPARLRTCTETKMSRIWTGIFTALLAATISFSSVPMLATPDKGIAFFAVMWYTLTCFVGSEMYYAHPKVDPYDSFREHMHFNFFVTLIVFFILVGLTFYIPPMMAQAKRIVAFVIGIAATIASIGFVFGRLISPSDCHGSQPQQDTAREDEGTNGNDVAFSKYEEELSLIEIVPIGEFEDQCESI